MNIETGNIERFLALSDLYFKLTSVHNNLFKLQEDTGLQNAIRECSERTYVQEHID